MTIINVCNLFAPIVGPMIGIINNKYTLFFDVIILEQCHEKKCYKYGGLHNIYLSVSLQVILFHSTQLTIEGHNKDTRPTNHSNLTQ